jgi:hypothetical protein
MRSATPPLQVNAKYWVTNLLATTVGTSDDKTVVASKVTVVPDGPPPPPPPPAGTQAQGTCGMTAYVIGQPLTLTQL